MQYYLNGVLTDMTPEQIEELAQNVAQRNEKERLFGYIEKRINRPFEISHKVFFLHAA